MVQTQRDDLRDVRRQLRAKSTVITILAEPPPGWNGPPLNDDGNQAIDQAEKYVLPKADVQMRASVTDSYAGPAGHGLRDRFEHIEYLNTSGPAPLGPCIIQIIGHGRPGQLGLGYYWNNLYQGKPDSEFYSLDGNPRAYWQLGIWELPSECEIWLLGCNVGQTSYYDAAGDGSALLYDLSHLLQRPVKGAATEIHVPADFEDGLYMGPLLQADKPQENAAILRADLASSPDGLPLAVSPPRVTAVTGIATLATHPETSRKLHIPAADLGLSFPLEVANPGPILPLPDLEVDVTFDGRAEMPGQIYGNGRFLRVKPAPGHGPMRTFARRQRQSEDTELRRRVQRHLRDLVRGPVTR